MTTAAQQPTDDFEQLTVWRSPNLLMNTEWSTMTYRDWIAIESDRLRRASPRQLEMRTDSKTHAVALFERQPCPI